ncbi:hypothetical protein LJC68_08975 [Bacteroidales bacterium OttesenSCG-928-B11]|nr:hypothetical protein [Bacteroidales bacterium OttesenSCG-928-C03]MDL2312992.1 hypothetical protein [Bacteroidales bacterium OttesenSCG-928-B11]
MPNDNNIICSLEMEDLNKGVNCGNNMSGVKSVYVALKDDVASIPSLPNLRNHFEDFAVLQGDIAMIGDKRFYHIYCNRDMGELKYATQGTFGGKSFRANLEIFHAGFKAKLLGFTAAVMNSELLILCKLNNGETHLLGDKDRGCEFGDSVELSSGKAITDNNGGTFNFVYDTPTAQIYTGTIDSITGVSDII